MKIKEMNEIIDRMKKTAKFTDNAKINVYSAEFDPYRPDEVVRLEETIDDIHYSATLRRESKNGGC